MYMHTSLRIMVIITPGRIVFHSICLTISCGHLLADLFFHLDVFSEVCSTISAIFFILLQLAWLLLILPQLLCSFFCKLSIFSIFLSFISLFFVPSTCSVLNLLFLNACLFSYQPYIFENAERTLTSYKLQQTYKRHDFLTKNLT